MKKLSITIAVLAAAIVSAGPVTHHKTSAPSTIQADYPFPPCNPTCALPTPQ